MKKKDETPDDYEGLDIAIVGFACRLPGAKNADEFWENLRSGVESITFFSDEELIEAGVDPDILANENYVKAAPILEGVDMFDARLFGYSPREARMIDPQHRLLLECAWEALEHAGYDPAKYEGPIGVFAGAAMNTYLLFSGLLPHFNKEYLLTLIGNDKDFLATRISYKLNLRGPSVSIQTACSSSLVATHMACQSLLNEECDLALAGGVSVRIPQKSGYFYQEGSVFSPDGHCRTFDAKAKGTVFGSGAGVIALKRLSDAIADRDSIHAVIKGTAINNDGSSKVEFTAPSVVSQSEAIAQAIAHAGVDAETISYVEAHGTGTRLGDPIEVTALTKAFRAFTEKNGFCAIGSAKSNIGHMDAAAGVTGLIKTALALKHNLLPPSLHYEEPNPEIDFENSPFYVNAKLSEWSGGPSPRRAGINSLGMGGTNAFAIIEEAPVIAVAGESRSRHLLTISAQNETALETATARLANHLSDHPETNLADAAYTLRVGRRDLDYKRMLVCRDSDEALARLRAPETLAAATVYRKPATRDVAFMFTGQGAQSVNMGREIYETETIFKEQVDRCCEILKPHLSLDLREVLFPDETNSEQASRLLDQTYITQPALFVIEYALANLWMEWGVRPGALIGHSVGEYVAACVAGVLSLKDALSLIAARGRLMQQLPEGAMLAVPLPEQELSTLLNDGVSLAAINGASLCVVAGNRSAIEEFEKKLSPRGLKCRPLRTSRAFHSAMVEPVLTEFAQIAGQVSLKPPAIPFISNVTGGWINNEEATDPNYWAKHMRQGVRFAQGVEELLKEPTRILLEVGPGQTLAMLASIHPARGQDQAALASLRSSGRSSGKPPSEQQSLLETLGQLWLSGVEIDWHAFYAGEMRHRIPLPSYPFQRESYWIEPLEKSAQNQAVGFQAPRPSPQREPAGDAAQPRPQSSEKRKPVREMSRQEIEQSVASIWEETLGVTQVSLQDDFFDLGGTSILIMQAIARINEAFETDLSALNLLESPTVAGLADCIERVIRIGQSLTANAQS